MSKNKNLINKKYPLTSHVPAYLPGASILLKRSQDKTSFKYDTLDFKSNTATSYSTEMAATTTVPKANASAVSTATTTGTSKTILITNNYNAQGLKTTTNKTTTTSTSDNLGHGLGLNNNTLNTNNSITIVTSPGSGTTTSTNAPGSAVVLDRINICINNHFNDPHVASSSMQSIKAEPMALANGEKKHSTASEADSTSHLKMVASKMAAFHVNEDVLVKQNDGLFYLGTIVAIGRNKCLIQFDDNTERWSLFEELSKLSASGQSETAPLCVVCKNSATADTVEVCEKCGRGYHKKCTDGDYEKNGTWSCKRCTAQNGQRASRLQRADIRRLCSGVEGDENQPIVKDLSQLPYDINALHWDPYHRVNMEQIYCYCGKNGEWYIQMLQCWRCQQWFHEKCVRCLSVPLYYGDRFFLFICMACNEGTEFIRRLELAWADIIHLLIFNLTVNTSSKYHDLTKVIIPYIEDNLSILQIPKESLNMPLERRTELIRSIIKSDKARFKCGREIKKNSNLFGLRSRIPPQSPTIILPANGPKITEAYLKGYLPNEIRFLAESATIKYDQNVYYKMSGKAYESCNSDDDEPVLFDAHLEYGQKMYEEDEIPVKFVIEKDKAGGFNGCKTFQRPADDESYVRNLFPKERIANIHNLFPHKDDEPLAMPADPPITQSMNSMMDISFDSDKSHELGDDSSSLILKETTTTSSNSSKSTENSKDGFVDTSSFKATTTTTTTTTTSSGGGQSRRRRMRQRSQSQNITRVKRENSLDICDSSGDDDTSSRSTLDLIIPPPKNFRGTNNPFHKQNLTSPVVAGKGKSNATSKKGVASKKNTSRKDKIFLQKQFDMLTALQTVSGGQQPNQLRIVRTVKRKLSASDIVVGPNMEVKRRKVGSGRRSTGNCEVISTTVISTAKPIRSDYGNGSSSSSGLSTPQENAPNIPPPPPSSITQRLTKTINGRRLRQRPEKNYSDTRRSSTGSASQSNGGCSSSNLNLPCSPIKGGVKEELSLSDLQSSLQAYIGVGSRIANGEKFRVRGKRISMDGRLTYLLEWEGGVSSLL